MLRLFSVKSSDSSRHSTSRRSYHAARQEDRPRRQRLRGPRGRRLPRPAAMPIGHAIARAGLPRRAPRASAPPPPGAHRPRSDRPGARAVRAVRPAAELQPVVVAGRGQNLAVDRRGLPFRRLPQRQRGGAATGALVGGAPLPARRAPPAPKARRRELRQDRQPVPRRALAHRALGPGPARGPRGGRRGGQRDGHDGRRRR